MKFFKKLLLLLLILIIPLSAAALIPLQVNQGGTGITTLTGIPYGTGTAGFSQVTIGSGLTFSGGTLTSTGGTGTPGTPVNSVQFNSASAFAGDSNFLWDNTNKQLQLGGTSGFSATTNTPLSLAGTVNTYLQSYIQNKSNGTSATGDYIAGADNDGVALTGHYSDMGINSSGWTKAANPLFNAEDLNDGYFITSGGNQNLGADGSLIRFLQGGFTTTNEVARLSSSGLTVGLAGTTLGKVLLSGSTSGTTTLQPVVAASGVITVPSATDTLALLGLNQTFTGINTFTPAARSSGSASYLTINPPADTGITTTAESKGINVAGSTRTWADGTVPTQREYFFGAPTYNKTTTSATFTNAGTLVVGGAPVAGTGVTITNPYSIWSQGGASLFEKDGIGAVTSDGIILNNTTAAAAGAQQFSPALHFIANGWKTTATAASQQVEWIMQDLPTQHATTPGNDLTFINKINGTSGVNFSLCSLTTGGSGALFEIDGQNCGNASGGATGLGAVNASNVFGVFNNSSEQENFNTNGIGMGATKQLMWFSAGAGNSTTGDTAIVRNAAGVLEINNGTTGTFADLKLRNIVQTGKTTTYNNIATVSNGTPSEYGTADLTAQSAAVAATTIYTPAASGMFRVSVVLQVTTASSTSSILAGTTGVIITYTEPDGSVAQSVLMALDDQNGTVDPGNTNTTNTTGTSSHGQLIIYAKTGVAIQYAIGYTSVGVTPMQYSAHLKVEAL